MINFKDITKAVETILNENTVGFTIKRNPIRNDDPEKTKPKAWIGIYRGTPVDYDPYRTGSQPWLVSVNIVVEIQVASWQSGDDAEDKLQTVEEEIMTILNNNKKLSGTIENSVGYSIDYEFNADENVFYHAAIITIKGEVFA